MDKIEVGMRVLIPFGGKKIYTGIVAELFDEFEDSFVRKKSSIYWTINQSFQNNNWNSGIG